jgi:single-strand DNA-binding protein
MTNIVIVDGALGRDPEIKTTTTGKSVANFSVAVENGYGAAKKEPFWFNVTAWNELADLAGRELSKGSKLTVYGRLTTRSWEKDGQKRTVTEIVANAFDIRKDKAESKPKPQAQEIADEDIPF